MTPQSRDWKAPPSQPPASRVGSAPLNEQACEQACLYSHPDPMTSNPGVESSNKHPGCALRLNPVFVAWLMGWVLVVPTGCDSLATEWCRFKQHMRLCLCSLLFDMGSNEARLLIAKREERVGAANEAGIV
jgi:hypothetical protein